MTMKLSQAKLEKVLQGSSIVRLIYLVIFFGVLLATFMISMIVVSSELNHIIELNLQYNANANGAAHIYTTFGNLLLIVLILSLGSTVIISIYRSFKSGMTLEVLSEMLDKLNNVFLRLIMISVFLVMPVVAAFMGMGQIIWVIILLALMVMIADLITSLTRLFLLGESGIFFYKTKLGRGVKA